MKLLLVVCLASVTMAFPISDLGLTTDPNGPSEADLVQAEIMAPERESFLQRRHGKGGMGMGLMGLGGGMPNKDLGELPSPLPPPPAPATVVMYPAYGIKPFYNYNYNSGGQNYVDGSYGGGDGPQYQRGPNFPFQFQPEFMGPGDAGKLMKFGPGLPGSGSGMRGR